MYCYTNGTYVEADQAVVSVFDPGFMRGEAIFDVWRTYGGSLARKVFSKHLARLAQGMRYLRLDHVALMAEIDQATTKLLELNAAHVQSVGDVRFWCAVSPGSHSTGQGRATVVITVSEIDFSGFFPTNLYETGAHLTPSIVVQNPWGAVDPRIKTTSRLSLYHAELKRREVPGTWAMLYDADGYITEAGGASLALIKDGDIVHAPREKILGGISLSTFCELGTDLGARVREQNLTIYDFIDADEVWVMSSSIAAVPVSTVDGIKLERRGSLGQAILQKWIEYVDFDFRTQAIERLPPGR